MYFKEYSWKVLLLPVANGDCACLGKMDERSIFFMAGAAERASEWGAKPSAPQTPANIKIRIPHAVNFAFGPGKAAPLEAIDQYQSISASGRSLGLSYTKTRRLLDELRDWWTSPRTIKESFAPDRSVAYPFMDES